jgi:hypothetical protein
LQVCLVPLYKLLNVNSSAANYHTTIYGILNLLRPLPKDDFALLCPTLGLVTGFAGTADHEDGQQQ